MNVVDLVFIVVVVVLTTAAGCMMTKQTVSVRPGSVLKALLALVDWVGAFVAFFAGNLLFGALVILVIRRLTPRFVSLYALENVLLIILSGVQAFIFQFHRWSRD
jgi:hypothetical protein